MAKDRVQVGPLSNQEVQVRGGNFTPHATPVSTLYNPATQRPAETNAFLQLAQGLSDINPTLNQFLDLKQDKYTQEEIQAGRDAQLRNKMAFKDAIDSGKIPAGASPWFVKGYQQQEQRLNGMAFDQALRESWAQSSIRNSDDPNAFKAWMQGFTEEWMTKYQPQNAPESQVFTDHVTASQNNLFNQHVAYRQQEIERKVVENTHQELLNLFDRGYLYKDDETLAKQAKGILDDQVSRGLNGTTANKIAVEAIKQKALEKLDPSLLKLMDMIDTGNGMLGNTAYAREVATNTSFDIAGKIQTNAARIKAAHEMQVQQDSLNLSKDVIGRILQNPAADVSDLMAQANSKGADVFENVAKSYKAATSYKTDIVEDPGFINDVTRKVIFDDSYGVDQFVAETQGKLSPSTASRLFNELNDKVNDPKWMRGSWIGRDLQDIEEAVVHANAGEGTGIPIEVGGSKVMAFQTFKRTPEIDRKVIEAKSAYYDMFRSIREGKPKDLLDLQKKMNEGKLQILERYAKGSQASTQSQPGKSQATTAAAAAPQDITKNPDFIAFAKALQAARGSSTQAQIK